MRDGPTEFPAALFPPGRSHSFVVGTAAAFGNDPLDNLVGIGDVAGLAVDAVGRVDFQPQLAFFRGHFVHRRWTKVLAGISVFGDALGGTNVQIRDDQMAGLVFLVARAGVVDIGEAVEGQLGIALEALGSGRAVDFVIRLIAGVRAHRVNQAAPAGNQLQARVKHSTKKTVLKGLMEIAHRPEFSFDPALLDFFRKGRERFRGSVAREQSLKNSFGRQHPALHGHVDALEALRIQKARGVADNQPAVHVGSRHGVPATVRNRLRAVTHQLPAVENALQERMRLVFLERFVRVELRILVFQSDHQADGKAVVAEAVNPSSAVGAEIHRPAERMRDKPGLHAPQLHIPKLLDADAVGLRVDVVELFSGDQVFGQRAARAFGEHGDFRAEFVAGRVVVLGLAVFVHAFVFRYDSGDALAFINQLRAAELREKIYARLFHQAAKPLHQLAQRNNVIAAILERGRGDGKAIGGILGEEKRGIVGDRRIERRGFLKIRHQFGERARIHDGSGKLMRADFAPFFEDVDIFSGKRRFSAGFVVFLDEVGQVQRAGKARRPRPDDENIGFELLALYAHRAILAKRPECYRLYELLAFSSCSVRAGMISKISPTMA